MMKFTYDEAVRLFERAKCYGHQTILTARDLKVGVAIYELTATRWKGHLRAELWREGDHPPTTPPPVAGSVPKDVHLDYVLVGIVPPPGVS